MLTITLSDLHSIVKIHGLAHERMIQYYTPIPGLLESLGPLLHEKFPSLVKDYQRVEHCFRDNFSTYQEAGWGLEAYTQQILDFKGTIEALGVCPVGGDGIPERKVPLKGYHTLVQDQIGAYTLLHYRNLTIQCALSSMRAHADCQIGLALAVQPLSDAFKALEAFTAKIRLFLKTLDPVLVQVLASDEASCVRGIELLVRWAAAYVHLNREKPLEPSSYEHTVLRFQRLKEAQAAHCERVRREAPDENPEEESLV